MNPTYIIENTFAPAQFAVVATVGAAGASATKAGTEVLQIVLVAIIALAILGIIIWYMTEESNNSKEEVLELQA
jgi:hypothetical protein